MRSDQLPGYDPRVPHVALLGSPSLLDHCAPEDADGLTVTRIDDASALDAPVDRPVDAIVAFDPSEADLAALVAAGRPTIVWWQDAAPEWAARAATAGGDLVRTVTGAAEAGPDSWRSVALPVADRLFADLSAQAAGPDGRTAIAVNFADESGPPTTPRALVALAGGQLLVSERLRPSRGLEPGIDYLEIRDLQEIRSAVDNAVRAPEAFLRVRLRGRRKAELFRSSRVVARLVGDLLLELDLAVSAR